MKSVQKWDCSLELSGGFCIGKSLCQAGAVHIDLPLTPFKDLLYKEPSVLERTLAGFHVALKPGMLLRGRNPGRWLMMTISAKAASVPSQLVLLGFTAGLWEAVVHLLQTPDPLPWQTSEFGASLGGEGSILWP